MPASLQSAAGPKTLSLTCTKGRRAAAHLGTGKDVARLQPAIAIGSRVHDIAAAAVSCLELVSGGELDLVDVRPVPIAARPGVELL